MDSSDAFKPLSATLGVRMGFGRNMTYFRIHENQSHGSKLQSVELEKILKENEKQKKGRGELSESEKKVYDGYWEYYGNGIPDNNGKYPKEVLPPNYQRIECGEGEAVLKILLYFFE